MSINQVNDFLESYVNQSVSNGGTLHWVIEEGCVNQSVSQKGMAPIATTNTNTNDVPLTLSIINQHNYYKWQIESNVKEWEHKHNIHTLWFVIKRKT